MEYSRQTENTFHFIDGPPFVSSETLHYGHILVSCVKSAILHYKYMNGYSIQNTIGYDCHGLPIEMRMNDELKLKTTKDIINYGIDKYNKVCKNFVKKCETSWTPIYKAIGRVVDEQDVYRTVDEHFMRTVWNVFNELWKNGYITNGYRVVPYSLACGTSLSNFEASQNYKDVIDTAAYWAFDFTETNKEMIVIWTTTPWTLPANHAICVNPELSYTLLKSTINNVSYWVATNRITAFQTIAKHLSPFEHVDIRKGDYFVGNTYYGYNGDKYPIVSDSYVKDDSGTGFVHLSPEFGEDDLRIIEKCNIKPRYGYIDDDGIILWGTYKGQYVLDTSKKVLKDNPKNLIARENYKHSYPYCWRTDTPLIYRAMNSFFVSVSAVKSKLCEYNKTVNWVPEYVGTRRFNDWLENARDWGISRNRVFGTPIPIWTDGESFVCLEESEFEGDLHRDKIDSYTFVKDGKTFKRVSDIFDCWFESGCVPFVVGNQAADVIVEGLDQTRGWFYTLMVLWGILKKEAPYKSVVTCGLILAEDGKKMSKRLNNYKNVMELVSEHSADTLRLYLLNSVATYGECLKFSEKDMTKQMRRLIPYKNAVVFWKENGKDRKDLAIDNSMDKWILSEMSQLIKNIRGDMEKYAVRDATDKLFGFVDILCNKYLRLQRNTIRKNGSGVLWNLLKMFTELLTPFTPFMCEEIWKSLGEEGHPLQSNYPVFDYYERTDISKMFDLIDKVRALRDLYKLPHKKPIQYLHVNCEKFADEILETFQMEVNAMDIVWDSEELKIEHNDTPEVIRDYTLRMINREICNSRKRMGLKQIDVTYCTIDNIDDTSVQFYNENKEAIHELFGESGKAENKLGEIHISLEIFKGSFSLYM